VTEGHFIIIRINSLSPFQLQSSNPDTTCS